MTQNVIKKWIAGLKLRIENFENNEGVKKQKMHGKTVKRNEKIEILIVKLLLCNNWNPV